MLSAHDFKIVLVEPEIPHNTGNIARLCAATGAQLHLVRPLGFFLSDRHLKRAAMDYLKDVRLTVHDDLQAVLRAVGSDPVVLTSGKLGCPHWTFRYSPTSWLFFGKESAGLPADFLAAHRDSVVQIPMRATTRGLNLATAAGVVLYEGLRQILDKQR